MKLDKKKALTVAGAMVTVIGWILSWVSGSIDDMKMEEAVAEEVTKQLDERAAANKQNKKS